jgi:hypothetical protein
MASFGQSANEEMCFDPIAGMLVYVRDRETSPPVPLIYELKPVSLTPEIQTIRRAV